MEEVRREKDQQVKEKDRVIELLQSRVTTLERCITGALPPVEFTVPNYSQKKGTEVRFDGPTFYTYPRESRFKLVPTMVKLYQLPGEFDDEIKWPVKCTVTVHLLNQLGDHDHIRGSKTLMLTRPQKKTYTGGPDPLMVPYTTIHFPKVGIQYLKDGCLKVRVYIALK